MENLTCKCGKEMSCGMKTFDWEKMTVTMSYNCYECGEKATVKCEMGIPTIRFDSDLKEGTMLLCYCSIDETVFNKKKVYTILKKDKNRHGVTVYEVEGENGQKWKVPLNGYLWKFDLI